MKLLKLNNGSTLKSQWTNRFNGIKIKPYSKIAFKNISLEVNNIITITGENNKFKVQVTKNRNPDTLTDPTNIVVPEGEYKTFESLMNVIQYQLNAMMDGAVAPTNQRGMQWKLDYDKTEKTKLAINYAKTDLEVFQPSSAFVSNFGTASAIPGAPAPPAPPKNRVGYVKNSGDGVKYDAVAYSLVPFSWSSGLVDAYIRRAIDTNSGWCFGLAEQIEDEMKPVNYVFAIFSESDGIVKWLSNSASGTIGNEENDIRRIYIRAQYFDTAGAWGNAGSYMEYKYSDYPSVYKPFVYNINYRFCFSCREIGKVGFLDDSANKQQIRWIRSAFFDSDSKGNIIEDSTPLYLETSHQYVDEDSNPINAFSIAYRYISFDGSKLGNVLGFPSDKFITGLPQNSYFKSTYPVQNRVLPTSLNIYTPNLMLESYTSKGRENIIAILPDVSFQQDTYKYVLPDQQLLFIDLNNSNTMNLDEIEIKIISGDEKDINGNIPLTLTEKGCTIALVIDG